MNYCKSLLAFFYDLFSSRTLIWQLVKKDIQSRYLGSFLGILWAFIQPTATILIFWFVFQVGFKSMPVANFPFILWLMAGMLPWFFFAEALSGATTSILENSFLVKKVVFRVSILPVIKIVAALFIHLFFIVFMIGMFVYYGYSLQWIYLQVFYYLFALIVLLLGLAWITASLIIFLRDIGQVVGMLLQFGFWLTPIFWSLDMIPARYQSYLQLNPVYYIVNGYRNTFIYHQPFWLDGGLSLYFWFIALGLFFVGALLFRKLRPHFADVL